MAKKDNNELMNPNEAFLIYQDDNGIARVNVRFEGEDVWLDVEQRNYGDGSSDPLQEKIQEFRNKSVIL